MSAIQNLTGAKNSNGGGFVDVMSKSAFVFSNPTENSGIPVNATPTAISFTESALIIDNPVSEDLNLAKTVVVDHVKLRTVGVGADSTEAMLYFYIDDINRYSSGGTQLVGKPTTSGGADNVTGTPTSNVYFGDLTALAPSATNRKINSQYLGFTGTPPVLAVGNEFYFQNEGTQSGTSYVLPVHYIKPGGSLIVHPLILNQTAAPTFEVEISLFEI